MIGAILFSVLVFFLFRSRLVYTSRKEDGTLKENIPLTGFLTMGVFLITVVLFFILANYFGIVKQRYHPNFGTLLLINFFLYLLLFLFDTLIIDALVLGRWRPTFLDLPDAMGGESMKEHIRRSIPVGVASGVIISLVSTAISFILMSS